MNLDAHESISDEYSFIELGLDSIMTIELRDKLQAALGANILLSIDVTFKFSNITKLTDYIAGLIKMEGLEEVSTPQIVANSNHQDLPCIDNQESKSKTSKLTSSMIAPWRFKFLDKGYKREFLYFEQISITPHYARGLLHVSKFCMQADGQFHLTIFHTMGSLLQIFKCYINVMLELNNIVKPIRNPNIIAVKIKIIQRIKQEDMFFYHIDFSFNDNSFFGRINFAVKMKQLDINSSQHANNKLMQLDQEEVQKIVPSWMNNIYKNCNYKIKNVLVSKNKINGQVKTNIQFQDILFHFVLMTELAVKRLS